MNLVKYLLETCSCVDAIRSSDMPAEVVKAFGQGAVTIISKAQNIPGRPVVQDTLRTARGEAKTSK